MKNRGFGLYRTLRTIEHTVTNMIDDFNPQGTRAIVEHGPRTNAPTEPLQDRISRRWRYLPRRCSSEDLSQVEGFETYEAVTVPLS